MKKGSLILVIQLLSHLGYGQTSVISQIDSLVSASDYAGAKEVIELAASNSTGEDQHRLYNKLAEVAILQGKLDEAEKTLKSLISAPTAANPFLLAETKTNLGFLYLNKARNDIALTHFQEALDLYQQAGQANSVEAARCLANLSQVYATTGKLNQAEESGVMAMQLRKRLRGETSEDIAASYNDLGLIYAQTDPAKALEYFEMALAVYEKIHGKQHRKIAIANNNMGIAYREQKFYGEAILSFETAEAIWNRIYPEGHPNEALALVNLGLTYGKMENVNAALGYYDRALAMYRKSYGEKHSDISAVLNQMGVIRKDQSNFAAALSNFQAALLANSPTFSTDALETNPHATDYYNAKVMLYSLRLKAETLEAQYLEKTLRLEDLKLALRTLQSCDTLIDNIRFNSTNESDKLEIGSSANDVYESGVRIAHAISESTIDHRRYQKLAFYFAEKSKSAVLQESIADSEAKSFAGIPIEMLEEENQLKASIALLAQKLSQKPGLTEEAALREKLFTSNRQYQGFVRHLETDYPDYFNLKFNQATPSIEDIQKLLGTGRAVVSYFISEKGLRLYSFVITQKSFRVYNSTLPVDFERLIKGFTNGIYYVVPNVFKESAERLSTLLLRGIPSVPELIVIPSGRLGTVPFEALTYGKIKADADFGTYPYLVNRQAISYEFSAGLLLQKSAHQAAAENSSIFLCAPITFPEKDRLADLPGTEQEVNSIATLFTANAKVAIGTEANESLIKSGSLANYRYLHFATHGIVDQTSPELSRIYLQSTDTEDGNVYSGEIFNLKLNADLAVLSACQTGLGKYAKGEGVIGLSRALVYAGARTIMVSYWSVADESTAELMTDFYQILLRQASPNPRMALQQAKRNMLKKGKYVSPYFWAPFVLIGS